MPDECLPIPGKPRGRLSYTINNEPSGAKVEVLLKAQAFRIVKLALHDRAGFLAKFSLKNHPSNIWSLDHIQPPERLV